MGKKTRTKAAQPKRYEGEVKFFLLKKGYGFISDTSTGVARDVFFHWSNVLDDIDTGDLDRGVPVTYELRDSARGPEAVNISSVW